MEWRQGHFMCYPIAMRFLHQRGFNAVEEVTATQYVEENTSMISAPRILDCVSVGDPRCPRLGLIVIQALGRVKTTSRGRGGKSLHILSEQQDIFVERLRGWFKKLQSLPPPYERVISGFLEAASSASGWATFLENP